jgi:hemoglobin-like flavoprotein
MLKKLLHVCTKSYLQNIQKLNPYLIMRKAINIKKLAGAIAAFASNIDNLEALSGAVEKMATTHVKPIHYPMVGDSLISAMSDILGDDFTSDHKQAWGEAYNFLGEILMNREKELYAQN